jgi:hypothetical protein
LSLWLRAADLAATHTRGVSARSSSVS